MKLVKSIKIACDSTLKLVEPHKLEGIMTGILVLALIPFIYLAFFTFPSADDYDLANMAIEKGVFGAVKHWYLNWTGRYFSIFLTSVNPLTYNSLLVYRLVPVILILSLTGAIYMNIRIFIHGLRRKEVFLLTMLAMFLLIYNMPSTSQGFYWFSASITYTLGSIMMLWLFPLLWWLHRSKSKYWFPLGLAVFLVVAITGSNELMLGLLFGILVAVLVYRYLERMRPIVPWVVLVIICFIAVLVVISAPGNTLRSAEFDTQGRFFSSIISSVSTIERLLQAEFIRLFVYSFLVIPIYFRSINASYPNSKQVKLLVYPAIAIALWLIIPFSLVFPLRWSIGVEGPPRALNVIHTAVIILWFYVVYAICVVAKTRYNLSFIKIPRFILWFILLFTAFNLTNSSNIRTAWGDIIKKRAAGYAHHYKVRLLEIQQCATDTCIVSPFSNVSATLHYKDITHSHDNWKNLCYSKFFSKASIITRVPDSSEIFQD